MKKVSAATRLLIPFLGLLCATGVVAGHNGSLVNGEAYVHTGSNGEILVAIDNFENDGKPDGTTDRVFVFQPDEFLKDQWSIEPGHVQATLEGSSLRLSAPGEPAVLEFGIGLGEAVSKESLDPLGREIIRLRSVGTALYEGEFFNSIEDVDAEDLFGLKAMLTESGVDGAGLATKALDDICNLPGQEGVLSCTESCGGRSCSRVCHPFYYAACRCVCFLGIFCRPECACCAAL